MGLFESIEEENDRAKHNLHLATQKAIALDPIIRSILDDLRKARWINGIINGGIIIDTQPPHGFIPSKPGYGRVAYDIAKYWIGDKCPKYDDRMSETGLSVYLSFCRPFDNKLNVGVDACGELECFQHKTQEIILSKTGGHLEFRYWPL